MLSHLLHYAYDDTVQPATSDPFLGKITPLRRKKYVHMLPCAPSISLFLKWEIF